MNESEFYIEEQPMMPPPKKGSIWVPVLLLVLMFTFGTAVYAISFITQPADSTTPWFSVRSGALYFDESQYTGGPELEIPSEIDGQRVTAISDNCFRYCDALTTVTIPDTVTEIGSGAFFDCDSLRGVKIPVSVEYIGDDAFFSCSSLEAVSVPASVTYIGEDAFTNCSKLQHVFFDGTVDDWASLYPQEINKNAQIYLVDGPNPQDFNLP